LPYTIREEDGLAMSSRKPEMLSIAPPVRGHQNAPRAMEENVRGACARWGGRILEELARGGQSEAD